MNILGKVNEMLASRGNISFLVLVDYKPLTLGSRRVYVKLITKNGNSYPIFGVFSGEGKMQEFVEDPSLQGKIEQILLNRSVGRYTIPVADQEDTSLFMCELNECLRVINFVRPIFNQLMNTIYKEGVISEISSPTIKFSVSDVNNLHSYFEGYFADVYRIMFDTKIGRLFSKNVHNSYLRLLLNLKEFIPFIFTGPCIVNPLIDSGRFSKVFKQTKIYNETLKHPYILKDSTVYALTNREICECLGLDRYIPFASFQVVFLILGLVNPKKYPSAERYVLYGSNGRVYSTMEEAMEAGLPADGITRMSSLSLLCQNFRGRLGIRSAEDFNTYMDIISTANLL